uniref:(California timema) hypothetical protein n=1 Tax=Timema californicum TaxID=61474 RepID=A0A7R9P875_TIMCA|nr:unnamed protein product [Timema californicum]
MPMSCYRVVMSNVPALLQSTAAMECGLFSNSGSPSPVITEVPSRAGSGRSPAKSGLHVNFNEKGLEVKERREKFLTAKYGTHQMSLIRKRLAVEMWLYDELQKLYESSDTTKSREVEVDIDELLDMDSDDRRRRHLQELLADAKKSPHEVKNIWRLKLVKGELIYPLSALVPSSGRANVTIEGTGTYSIPQSISSYC